MSTATIPEVVSPASLADYFEVMTRAVFQAGVSWRQIAEHWEAYREAFASFDPLRVAEFNEFDVERVLATPGILRMPRKVRATIANAQTLLTTDRDCGGFRNIAVVRFVCRACEGRKKRFSFMGDMNVWYVLFRTGEPVPRFEEWVVTIPGEHPRMRDMVELARASGRSPERS